MIMPTTVGVVIVMQTEAGTTAIVMAAVGVAMVAIDVAVADVVEDVAAADVVAVMATMVKFSAPI